MLPIDRHVPKHGLHREPSGFKPDHVPCKETSVKQKYAGWPRIGHALFPTLQIQSTDSFAVDEPRCLPRPPSERPILRTSEELSLEDRPVCEDKPVPVILLQKGKGEENEKKSRHENRILSVPVYIPGQNSNREILLQTQ